VERREAVQGLRVFVLEAQIPTAKQADQAMKVTPITEVESMELWERCERLHGLQPQLARIGLK
jgi:hypothetical protein